MNRRNRPIVALFFILPGFSAWLIGCSSEHRTETAAPETINNVSVFVAQKTVMPVWLESVGTVQAAQTTQISSQTTGNIVDIRAHEGDHVESGHVLATIDDAQPRSAVDRASAAVTAAEQAVSAADSDLALADTTLKRYQQLYDKKSVSPQEFDEVKARFQSAEARRDMARAEQAQANSTLTQAKTSLGYSRIRAPFAGLLTERKADAGTMVSPGMPIFTIEDTRSYRLEATVDEGDIGLVHLGQAVPVKVDALGGIQLSGKVVQIVPAASATSRSFQVKIELPTDARLRSGLFGRAQFARRERPVLLIPRNALVERGQLDGVYVLDANRVAELRYVTLGSAYEEKVEVLSGLQDGDTIVAAPENRELGGKRIATQP